MGWIAGDVLLVGHVVSRSEFPVLFQTHAERIDLSLAECLVGVPRIWLMAGALMAAFTMPLYLFGTWHLWHGIRSAGRRWAVLTTGLIAFGYATSPLPHAAFYFLGAVYQQIAASDMAAHPPLLALASEFRQVLLMIYVPSVTCSALGLLAFSLLVASGHSAYPRWFALSSNPLLLVALTGAVPHVLGGRIGDALAGAAFNTAWLLIYLQSMLLLWRAGFNCGPQRRRL